MKRILDFCKEQTGEIAFFVILIGITLFTTNYISKEIPTHNQNEIIENVEQKSEELKYFEWNSLSQDVKLQKGKESDVKVEWQANTEPFYIQTFKNVFKKSCENKLTLIPEGTKQVHLKLKMTLSEGTETNVFFMPYDAEGNRLDEQMIVKSIKKSSDLDEKFEIDTLVKSYKIAIKINTSNHEGSLEVQDMHVEFIK